MLSGEIGTAMEIGSISWHREASNTFTDADCEQFTLHLGYAVADTLSTDSFDGNYIPGSKTLVFSTPLLTLDMDDEWSQIVLDEPFFYNGEGNLIIDIQWDNGTEDNTYYNWNWIAGENRCISIHGSSGILSDNLVPHMIFSGSLALENSTFGSIKVELGRQDNQ